jgi:hypothetical protein
VVELIEGDDIIIDDKVEEVEGFCAVVIVVAIIVSILVLEGVVLEEVETEVISEEGGIIVFDVRLVFFEEIDVE